MKRKSTRFHPIDPNEKFSDPEDESEETEQNPFVVRQRYHDSKEMIKNAMQVLKEMKYQKLSKGERSIFDEDLEFDGWHYIAERIFELPRSDRFVKVLEERYKQAQEREL